MQPSNGFLLASYFVLACLIMVIIMLSVTATSQ